MGGYFQALLFLTEILKGNKDSYTKAGVVWTLGMVGQHSSEHSRAICDSGAVVIMIDVR